VRILIIGGTNFIGPHLVRRLAGSGTRSRSFAKGPRFGGTSVETWERKLIRDRNPVFNWPVPHEEGQIDHGSPRMPRIKPEECLGPVEG
jgi:nucleoside-diphosphate-sugar epimerase